MEIARFCDHRDGLRHGDGPAFAGTLHVAPYMEASLQPHKRTSFPPDILQETVKFG